MALIVGTPKFQAFATGTGEFLTSGMLYSYVAGTLTPKDTFPTVADALADTNANSNPVVLDARGEANVVINGPTKLILKDSAGSTVWSFDNIDDSSLDIIDENGNELLRFTAVADAVNEWTITNAAAGDAPDFSTSGSDVDIDGDIGCKGTGVLHLTSPTVADSTFTSTGALTANGTLTTNSTASINGAVTRGATTSDSLVPAGCVMWYAGSTVPTGWLECDGAAVSRTTYSTLFGILSTTFGEGNGTTTFNLPSQARRTLVGRGGSGTATLANTIGATGGSETHTLTVAEMPAHTHGQVQSTVATQSGVNQTVLEQGTNTNTGSTGGDGAHNNMQPSLVLMMIIRAY